MRIWSSFAAHELEVGDVFDLQAATANSCTFLGSSIPRPGARRMNLILYHGNYPVRGCRELLKMLSARGSEVKTEFTAPAGSFLGGNLLLMMDFSVWII